MKTSIYPKIKVEIDIKEVLWKLLAQWKAVLLISLVMAMLLSGAKYLTDNNRYKEGLSARKEAAEQNKIAPEERVSKILNGLSGEDAEIIEKTIREQDWLDAQKEYIENSILMNIDPTTCGQLKLIYDVEGENAADIPVILEEYSAFIRGDKYRKAIGEIIDPTAESKYIGELIGTSSGSGPEMDSGQTGAVLNVSIFLPEESEAEKIIQASDSALSEYASKIRKSYKHSLNAAETSISHDYSFDLVSRHYDMMNRAYGIDNMVSNSVNAMTPEQRDTYEEIQAINNVSDVAEETGEEELAAPTVSVKHFILGFLLGVFLYVCAYVGLLILKKGTNSADNAQNYLEARIIGELYYDNEPEGFEKLLHSRAVEKLRYKGKEDPDAQLERIADTIEAVCNHAGDRQVTLYDLTGTSKSAKNYIRGLEWLEESISGRDINTNCLKASTIDAFDEKSLINIKNAVIAISSETRVEMLRKIKMLCAEYGINILGGLFMAEK